jgi:hypothetical protein
MANVKFKNTYSYVLERTLTGSEVVVYFKAWPEHKSNDRDVPDTPIEVEVWGVTVRSADGQEVRVDAFDFADNWDFDYIEQYIYDNIDELVSTGPVSDSRLLT